jgi:UDP-glucose 4-epimerase
MKILITGATGYIGSYLVKYLSKDDKNHIIPLCRKLPEHFDDWNDEFQVIEADVTDLNELSGKIQSPIDCLIHLASFNDINTSKFPDQALIVNGVGTRNVLEIARQYKCPNFIYFSTLQVYGKELQGKYTHETPVNCQDDYALTHFIAEEYCRMFSLRYKLNIGILRPSNVFGCPIDHRVNRWTLIPTSLCLSAFKDNKITLRSSGKQNRDFVSLDYVSKSVKHLIENTSIGFKIYNVTSEQLFSVKEIAQMVKSSAKIILNKDVELVFDNDHPLESNDFIVKNNIIAPYSKTIIRNEISMEISQIFDMLAANGG